MDQAQCSVKQKGYTVGREDGGREVVAVDEDLLNFTKSEAPMCGTTQPHTNKCKQ